MRACFGVLGVVISVARGQEPCAEGGDWENPDCTCKNNQATYSWDCFTDEESGIGQCWRGINDDFQQCKYKKEGGFFCKSTEKFASSGYADEPDKYKIEHNGVVYNDDPGDGGLGTCPGRLCNMGGTGTTDPNCYCVCKQVDLGVVGDGEGESYEDNCCKYSFVNPATQETNYGCIGSHKNIDFFNSKADMGTPLTIFTGYEEICVKGRSSGGGDGGGGDDEEEEEDVEEISAGQVPGVATLSLCVASLFALSRGAARFA